VNKLSISGHVHRPAKVANALSPWRHWFLEAFKRPYNNPMLHVMDIPIATPWWGRPRTRMLAAMAGAIVLILVLVFAGASLRVRSLRVAARDLAISTVVPGVFHDFVPLHATVVPRDTIYLDALEGGQVSRVLVQAGDRVVEGQPLILFRNAQLQLDVLNNEGRLVESITQLQTLQTQMEATRMSDAAALADIQYNIANLEHTAARYDPLLKAGALDAKTVEQVHDQLDHYRALLPLQSETNRRQEALRRAQLPSIEAEQESLKKSLDVTRAQIDDLTVRAPITGTITALDLKVGQNRNRGERLAEIVASTGFKLSADIDEYYLDRVRAGEAATVDLNGKTEKLLVTRVYPQVKNGTFTADFAFIGGAPSDLVTGAAADGRLSLGSDKQGLILPAGAFLEASGGDYVFVLDKGGHSAHRRRVKLGRRNIEQAEVLGGLANGDRVITSDYANYTQVERIDLKN
jgi:HlyD family secretion protein